MPEALSKKTPNWLTILITVIATLYSSLILCQWHNIERTGILARDIYICGMPDFSGGVVAMCLILFLYWRGILDFSKYNKGSRLIIILCDILIFAVMFSLIKTEKETTFVGVLYDDMKNKLLTAAAVFMSLTVLLFGTKNICKLFLIIVLAIALISKAKLIDLAYDIWGFVALISIFISFFVQDTVNMNGLKNEVELLYGKTGKLIKDSSSELNKIKEQL